MIDSVPSSPERFHVMAKPTGAICNLACSYCLFLDKEAMTPGSSLHPAYRPACAGHHAAAQDRP